MLQRTTVELIGTQRVGKRYLAGIVKNSQTVPIVHEVGEPLLRLKHNGKPEENWKVPFQVRPEPICPPSTTLTMHTLHRNSVYSSVASRRPTEPTYS